MFGGSGRSGSAQAGPIGDGHAVIATGITRAPGCNGDVFAHPPTLIATTHAVIRPNT